MATVLGMVTVPLQNFVDFVFVSKVNIPFLLSKAKVKSALSLMLKYGVCHKIKSERRGVKLNECKMFYIEYFYFPWLVRS